MEGATWASLRSVSSNARVYNRTSVMNGESSQSDSKLMITSKLEFEIMHSCLLKARALARGPPHTGTQNAWAAGAPSVSQPSLHSCSVFVHQCVACTQRHASSVHAAGAVRFPKTEVAPVQCGRLALRWPAPTHVQRAWRYTRGGAPGGRGSSENTRNRTDSGLHAGDHFILQNPEREKETVRISTLATQTYP